MAQPMTRMLRTDRFALVTGASSGIGAEIAREYAGRGKPLVLVARRADRLQALAEELREKARVEVIAADLADPAAPARLQAECAARGLPVDTLVNNAGFGVPGRYLTKDWATHQASLQVLLVAVCELTHRFLPAMEAEGHGRILNVASLAGFLPGPRMAVYYATKAYVLSFSEALFCELAPRGVRVTALCPGPVPTEFQARAGIVPGFDSKVLNISADAVAMAGYRGLMAGKRMVLPGLGMKVIPFMLRFVPRGLLVSLVGRVQSRR